MASGEFTDDGRRRIRGAVVDDNDLEKLARIGQAVNDSRHRPMLASSLRAATMTETLGR